MSLSSVSQTGIGPASGGLESFLLVVVALPLSVGVVIKFFFLKWETRRFYNRNSIQFNNMGKRAKNKHIAAACCCHRCRFRCLSEIWARLKLFYIFLFTKLNIRILFSFEHFLFSWYSLRLSSFWEAAAVAGGAACGFYLFIEFSSILCGLNALIHIPFVHSYFHWFVLINLLGIRFN